MVYYNTTQIYQTVGMNDHKMKCTVRKKTDFIQQCLSLIKKNIKFTEKKIVGALIII